MEKIAMADSHDDQDSAEFLTEDETDDDDTGEITEPFDPKLIKIRSGPPSLDTLIKRMREGEIDLSPVFQRAEVWKLKAKSRLIESLLIRIPLPAFYMDATKDDKWVVIDGLQRLSTLRDFILEADLLPAGSEKLRLSNLEFLKELEGKTFEELSRAHQRVIEETQLTIYLIEPGTPDAVKFNIFRRINTGGLPLSPQEIRHALNQGDVIGLLKNLAESEEFKQATANGVNDQRMAARECVLRFMAFTLSPPNVYKAEEFDAFLNAAMAKLNNVSSEEREALSQRFKKSMDASFFIWGENAFRKPSKNESRSPINKALFETVAVILGSLSDNEIEELKANRENVIKRVDELINDDGEFFNAISQGTGSITKIKYRFSHFENVLREMLK